MSWIITESITIQASEIRRIELHNQIFDLPSFNFITSQPISHGNGKLAQRAGHPKKYILTTIDNKTIELNEEDYKNIRKQLNDINQRDLEFSRYIKDYLEFKPGTSAFEAARKHYSENVLHEGGGSSKDSHSVEL
jgi:hypothetical protein